MSENNYSLTIYNDDSLIDYEGFIHTWIEISDGINPPKIYSYGADGKFSKEDESARRKELSDKITTPISGDQYNSMQSKGDALKQDALDNKFNYTLYPGITGDGNNCVTAANLILHKGGIDILKNTPNPIYVSGRINNANIFGLKSMNDPATRKLVDQALIYNLTKDYIEPLWTNLENGFNYAGNFLDKIADYYNPYNDLNEFKRFGLPDPLVINLGDKEEFDTKSLAESNAYFDVDQNGFAEKTGWIGENSAILARDLNGNGVIDGGAEVFGDHTVMADGSTASGGFDALKDLDSNGDGRIDADDDVYNTLRLWKDNGDGISQTDELHTLEELGVKSISVDSEEVNSSDGSGNTLVRTGDVEFSDGTVRKAGEFLFERDIIDTESAATYNGQFDIPDDIKLLPYLDGFSNIDDLHTAMAKDDTLRILVQDYAKKTDSLKLSGAFDKIMYKWFGVEDILPDSRGGNMDARQLAVLEKLFQSGFNGWWNQQYRSTNVNSITAVKLKEMYADIAGRFNTGMNIQTHLQEFVMLGALKFDENGVMSADKNIIDSILNFQKLSERLTNTSNSEAQLDEELINTARNLFLLKFEMISTAVKVYATDEELVDYVKYYLSKGDDYTSGLKIITDDSNIFLGSDGDDILNGDNSNNLIYGLKGDDTISGNDGDDKIQGGSGNDILNGGNQNDTLDGGTGDDYLAGGEHNDTYTYSRGDGSDVIFDLNDRLHNAASHDKLELKDINQSDVADVLREDNDILIKFKDGENSANDEVRFKDWFINHRGDGAYAGYYNRKIEEIAFADGTKWGVSDIEGQINVRGDSADNVLNGISLGENMYGHEGDDKIYGNDGDDILNGGTGNDYLEGGKGNDTYTYNRGDGSDVIFDLNDRLHNAASHDKLELKDINQSDVADVLREDNDILIKFKDGENSANDEVRFKDWFINHRGDGAYAGYYNRKIEEITFADGTKWGVSDIEGQINVRGDSADNVLNGISLGENMYGHEGDDKIYGNDGDDILNGGTGNDYLEGGKGNDTYTYNRGDGSDVIFDLNDRLHNAASHDKLELKDINQSDVADVLREDNDILIKFKDGENSANDEVRFKDWFINHRGDGAYAGYYNRKIEEITFADGTKWGVSDIEGQINVRGDSADNVLNGISLGENMYGYEGSDTISGNDGDDKIQGGSGNDILNGGNQNDTLDGGTGDDYLAGGEHNDTYTYSRGDGSDVIFDLNDRLHNAASHDKLELKDINQSDVADVLREDNDILIKFKDGENSANDEVRFKDWFINHRGDGAYAGYYNRKIEEITFADGTKWGVSDIEGQINVRGDSGNNVLNGISLGENMYGHEGDDKIYGNDGDDILNGGTGNDYLEGGKGNDTYTYSCGDGSDVIFDLNDRLHNAASHDKLELKDINQSDVADVLREDNDILIKFKDGENSANDEVRFKDWFINHRGDGAYAGYYNRKIEEITFADGTKWGVSDIEGRINVRGDSADNVLNGISLGENMYGYEGSDTISGNDGDDKIQGGSGNDILNGGNQNDTLDGGTGDDYLAGGEHNDTYTYSRGDGSDVIFDLNDRLHNAASHDKLELKDINQSDVADVLREDNDILIKFKDGENSANDEVRFKDWFINHRGDGAYAGYYNRKIEEITFADGTKWGVSDIEGQINVRGDSGNNVLNGISLGENMYGHEGDDKIYGNDGDDILNGGTGNDYLEGGKGNDTYTYNRGDGSDVIFDLNDRLHNAASHDKLELKDINQSDVADVLREDNDILIKFKDGENSANDEVRFKDWFINHRGDGAYAGYYNRKIEEITFADGTKWGVSDIEGQINVRGDSADNVLNGISLGENMYGYEGSDTISGNDGDDKIQGGSGNDILNGGNQNDTLDGGTGDDYLAGGEHNDTYTYSRGDGSDVIFDLNDRLHNAASHDKLELKDINQSDVADVLREDNDILIKFKDGENSANDEVRFKDWFINHRGDGAYAGYYNRKIEEITFADGTKWGVSDIEGQINVRGDSGNNVLNGISLGENMYGHEGDDKIYGNDGDDILNGGTGNDYLEGGKGNDTYTYNRGDGSDVIFDLNDRLHNAASHDKLELKDINQSDVADVLREDNDILIKFKDGENSANDEVRFKDWFINHRGDGAYVGYYNRKIEEIAFADGTKWGVSDIEGQINVRGDSADNVLNGISLGENMYGHEGDDKIYGNDGDDILNGGTGNDYLEGGKGNDTYTYNRGDGSDVIFDLNDRLHNAASHDKLELKDINQSDVADVLREDNDILIKFKDGENSANDEVRFKDWFINHRGDGAYAGYYNRKIEEITFADGTKWGVSDIEGRINVRGDSGNNVLNGISLGENMYGHEEDDKIYGNDGDDILNGGTGNDYLEGGKGNDTYTYNRGDGSDVIFDLNDRLHNAASHDKLELKDINQSDVADVLREDNDILIKFKDGENSANDEVRFKDWFINHRGDGAYAGYYNRKIEEITFADGTKWGVSDIEGQINVRGDSADNVLNGISLGENMYGYEGSDTISGNDGDDKIQGGSGNDKLNGGNQDDILDGGTGDDYLAGGEHNDTYTYSRGDGSDVIFDLNDRLHNAASHDKLELKDINQSDVADVLREDNDILIKFKDGENSANDEVRFKDWFINHRGDGAYAGYYNRKIEEITFADGTKWGVSDIEGRINVRGDSGNNVLNGISLGENMYGHEEDDKIYGNDGDDILNGGTGNDYLEGGKGNDTYIFNKGDGQDKIADSLGDDTLKIDIASSDILLSKMGNDLQILINGEDDKITISNWYTADTNKVERIETADHGVLLSNQADQLIQAMSLYENEKGITWSNAIDYDNHEAKDIVAAHWQFENKEENTM